MELLKQLEIGFRRFLLRMLALFIRRDRAIPSDIDFNRCTFLFVRQDRIGDVLVSTPLFVELKSRYPSCTIDILLSKNNYFVLDNEPLIRKRWIFRKNIFAIWRLLKDLRAEHYDFVIDLMDNPSATSTLLLALSGGRWNIGLSKENSYVYDVAIPLLSRRDTHIVDRLSELLRVFNISVDRNKLRLRYNVSASSAEFAESFWSSQQLSGSVVVGVNISAGSGVRFWGVAHFRTLIQQIQSNYPTYIVLILFHPSDQSAAKAIGADFSKVILSPLTHSFDQFAAMIRRVS
ncbi:MAG: glycosyltransferase family 9 protein, partial [Bacteroidota bacterium]